MSDGKAATARQFDSLPQNMSWIRLQGLCDFVWSFWLIFSLLRETFPNWCPLWLCEVCGCKARKCNWLRHLEPKKNRDGVENGGERDTGGEGEGTGRRSWNCSPYTSTTVIARVSSILVNNCHHFLVLPCFPLQGNKRNPRHPRMMMILEMSLGSSSWKAWAAINSRHGGRFLEMVTSGWKCIRIMFQSG